MNNAVCMSWLEKKIPEFKAAMDAEMAKENSNRDVMKRWQKLWIESNKKKTMIMNAVGAGAMTEEEYCACLKRQITKDTALFQYFKAAGNAKNAQIVTERISVTKEELSQM